MAIIICLANSYKHGGRCIAGIDLETGEWIRPVPNTPEQAITPNMRLINGNEPRVLDIIEVPLENYGPDNGCQRENRLLLPGRWKKVGQVVARNMLRYCEDDSLILHNHDNNVAPEFFSQMPKSQWKSLQLVHNSSVTFVRNPWGKWRAHLRDAARVSLDLKVTDPIVLEKLRNAENISRDCILTVSLATPWKPKDSEEPQLCYKMVAGVVEL